MSWFKLYALDDFEALVPFFAVRFAQCFRNHLRTFCKNVSDDLDWEIMNFFIQIWFSVFLYRNHVMRDLAALVHGKTYIFVMLKFKSVNSY